MRKRILASLTILVLFASISIAQTLPDEVLVTYACANKSLPLVLDELSNKTNVNIVYSANRLPKNKTVTIQATNEELGSLLLVILTDDGYRYKIVGDQIVIVRDDYLDADDYITLSGYVQDSVSGERLVYANVYLLDNTKGTESNEYGFFSFTLPKGQQRVYFSYLGYEQEALDFRLKEDTTLIIEMVPDVQLNEIVILKGDEVEADQNTSTESRMSYDELQSMTSLGGEADVTRMANMLPGVSSGADGFGGLNVRGGSADQNLILLDGVPVYNVGHALGIFSIFNSNVIKSASLIKGGFPARYGGRLSSVLDIKTREGSTKRTEGSVSISAIAIKASLEGPIGSGGSSYLLSARRTFVDPWIKAATEYQNNLNGDDGFSNYYFYDLNAKLNFQLGKKHKLLFSTYAGKDDFGNMVTSVTPTPVNEIQLNEINWDWGNRLATIRLNSQLTDKLFSKLSTYYSEYDFSSFDHDRFETVINPDSTRLQYKASTFLSNISDIGLRLDFDYIPRPSHFFKFGGGFINHKFEPGLLSVNQSDNIVTIDEKLLRSDLESLIESPTLEGKEAFGYIEDQLALGYGLMFNFGVHTSYIISEDQSYFNWQPRLAMMIRGETTYFKASASKMNQYLHLISNNGLGIPSEVWLPSTDRLEPQESWIYSATIANHSKSGMHIGFEGFYKTLSALTTFNEGGLLEINQGDNWQNLIPIGEGSAYGVEAFINKVAGKTTWMANYSYTKSKRQFDQLNNGVEFLHKYSLDHNAKLSLRHRLTDNAEFNLNYHISTGSRVTTPTGDIVQNQNGDILIEYTAKNNEQLPSYQRLDIGFSFYNKFKWGRQKISIGAYNVLNRKNFFYTDIERDQFNVEKFKLDRFSILPIFPALSYSLSF